MFSLSGKVRFYLYNRATDMRKSFNGLEGIVQNEVNRNPMSGDVHVFINRRKTMIKFLIWDRTGYWILYKRLERGSFR